MLTQFRKEIGSLPIQPVYITDLTYITGMHEKVRNWKKNKDFNCLVVFWETNNCNQCYVGGLAEANALFQGMLIHTVV